MQFIIKTVVRLSLFLLPLASLSQSSYLPQSHKHRQLLDRLEIRLQNYSGLNISTVQPLSRRTGVQLVEYADSMQQTNGGGIFTKMDEQNMQQFLMNNSEWVSGDKSAFESSKSIWNTFYRTKANLLEVDEKDFFLAINPVIQQQQSAGKDENERVFLNSKGLSFRGLIAERVGFSGFITDNQERPPLFAAEWVREREAVPGVGRYKRFKNTAFDYFDARGSIHFTAAKYLDFQFGYDKNFVGSGYRSLLLSDFGNSYLFLKINTRIWKLNYQNIFMELTPQFPKSRMGDRLLDKKYAVTHHLSVNATRWLNLGLFESVVFGRKNHFDFTYLNPVMFLRVAEQQNGSADNAIVGFDFKANVARTFQFYGQLMLDEFKLNEIRSSKGWWANKYGIQLGGKYINAFTIPNLDLQGELNFVRPFSYSHHDSISNYTHYNQPLAHPLGANFREAIAIARYQPHHKITASARLIFWEKGVDTAGANLGGDIFRLNTSRRSDYGYELAGGGKGRGINTQLLVSYELKENLFIDGSLLIRKWRVEDQLLQNRNTTLATIGLRMNVSRREYDY